MADDIKKIVENANFTVAPSTPYEAIACKGRAYKKFQHRFPGQQFFNSKDILIDAVTLMFRSTPKINVWRNRLPEEVVGYCYQLVPYRKMSFVMNLADAGEEQGTYMVAIVDDRFVRMPVNYTALYNTQMAKVAKG